jgi:hypothetical protein
MGRMELVQKIVEQNPHVGRTDVETIVNTLMDELSTLSKSDEVPGEGRDGALWQDGSPPDLELLLARLEALIAERPELADQSIDFLPPELVRAIFDAAFDSLGKSAAMLQESVRESEQFHQEFARRSAEIRALQADIDARLASLVATERRV